MNIFETLAKELNITLVQVEKTVALIDEGNTIPFIARYRKEVTGSLDDEILRKFEERLNYLRNIENRREEVIELIRAQEKLTPEIEEAIKEGKITYEELLEVLTNPNCKVNDDTKISSYEPHLTVKLTLTTKLISHLREWYPNALLVGFKLLENVEKEYLMEVARKLCIKNRMDYIIANDLHDLRQGQHLSFLVNEEGYQNVEFHSPEDIFEETRSLVLKRR